MRFFSLFLSLSLFTCGRQRQGKYCMKRPKWLKIYDALKLVKLEKFLFRSPSNVSNSKPDIKGKQQILEFLRWFLGRRLQLWSEERKIFKYLASFIFILCLSYHVRTICNFDFITFMRLYVNTVNEIVYEGKQRIFLHSVFPLVSISSISIAKKNLFLVDKKLICFIHVAEKHKIK